MANAAVSTESKVTQQEMPAWMQQYYGAILGRGLSTIDQPYKAYEGDRVAGFTPEQLQSFDMVQQGIGNWKPYVDQAEQMNTEAGAVSSAGAAQPYLTAGTSREAMTTASPYLEKAGAGSALTSANPYLKAGADSFTNNVGKYMNPYNDAVTNRIGEMAGRNLRENILPGVNRTFIGGGTFGGSRSAEFTARAVRDAQEAALAEQNKALQAGYGQAGELYGADATRNLTAAQTAGQLSSTDLSRQLDVGKSYADIANQIATNNLNAGQNAGYLTGADASRKLVAAGQIAGLGTQVQNQHGVDVGAVSQVGGQKQTLAQKIADVNYQTAKEKEAAPMKRLQDLQNLTSGMPMPVTTYENSTNSAPAPNIMNSLVGNAGAIIGGYNTLTGNGGSTTGGTAGGDTSSAGSTGGGYDSTGYDYGQMEPTSWAYGGKITKRKPKRGLGWLKDVR